jgi:hypothetical protein
LLLGWVASQFALAWAIDSSLWLRDPLYGDKYATLRRHVAERTTAAGRPLTMVVVGSSRTCYGLRGELVERELEVWSGRPAAVVNFGIPASGPITNVLSIRRLLESAERPDWIILEVLPPLIADRGPVPAEQPFLQPERLRGDDVTAVIEHDFPADDLLPRWRQAQLVPSFGYRFPLLGRLLNGYLSWQVRFDCGRHTDPTGWQRPVNDTVTPDGYCQGVAHARAEYYDLLQTLRFDTPAARAVAEAVAECRRHGTHVALLLMPEGSDFRGWYPPDVDAALIEFLRNVSRDAGAPLIDARFWLGDDAFCDSHHMLPDGAARFSNRLGRVVADLLGPAGPGPTD